MKPVIKLLCAASMIAALGGCETMNKWMGKESSATEQVPAKAADAKKSSVASKPHFSGYLGDYSKMKETGTPSGGTALRWVSPDLKKGKYHSIIIDPVGFYPRPPLLAKVSKGRMLEVVQYIAQQVRQEVGRDLKIVDHPGPGVLRWDAAITGVKDNTGNAATAGTASTRNLPVSMIFTDAAPTSVPADNSFVVYLESRLVDSQSKKVMAKSVRAGIGGKVADPKIRVTVEDMKPVLDGWVQDAGVFAREHIK